MRQLNLASVDTANNPKTAPDAPRLTVAAGSSSSETRLATMPQKQKENTSPAAPASSSTDLPNKSSRKTLPLRCDREPWQKHAVSGCHQAQLRWSRYSARMAGTLSTLSATKMAKFSRMSPYTADPCGFILFASATRPPVPVPVPPPPAAAAAMCVGGQPRLLRDESACGWTDRSRREGAGRLKR